MKKKKETMGIPAEAFFKYVNPDEYIHTYSLWITEEVDNCKRKVGKTCQNPVEFYYHVLKVFSDYPHRAKDLIVVINIYFDCEIVGRSETSAINWMRTFHENYDFTDEELERYRP